MKNLRFLRLKRVGGVALAVGMIFCIGCTRTVYVPMENQQVSREHYRNVNRHCDTVIFRDSVTTIIRGDTLERERVRERVHISLLHDTVRHTLTDTIRVKEQVPLPVEGKKATNFPAVAIGIILIGVISLWGISKLKK